LFGTARKIPGRPTAYGLVESDNNVPKSFFLQLIYPLSLLFVKPQARVIAPVVEEEIQA
jgi:hypothetical protein